MRLFDTHAHYDDSAFDGDRTALLSSMPEHGVELILDPGCDLSSSQKAVELAEQFPHVYAAVGVHPSECAGWQDLPAIIHDREAHQDCLSIVRAHPGVTGVYHCYSGSLEDARVLVKLGWMLSFTGVITYKNARRSHEVIRWLPMDRIMIETDSPYLSPVPFRGRRNDSTHVHLVAETIAQIKGMDPEEVARVTLENGRRFFRI